MMPEKAKRPSAAPYDPRLALTEFATIFVAAQDNTPPLFRDNQRLVEWSPQHADSSYAFLECIESLLFRVYLRILQTFLLTKTGSLHKKYPGYSISPKEI